MEVPRAAHEGINYNWLPARFVTLPVAPSHALAISPQFPPNPSLGCVVRPDPFGPICWQFSGFFGRLVYGIVIRDSECGNRRVENEGALDGKG